MTFKCGHRFYPKTAEHNEALFGYHKVRMLMARSQYSVTWPRWCIAAQHRSHSCGPLYSRLFVNGVSGDELACPRPYTFCAFLKPLFRLSLKYVFTVLKICLLLWLSLCNDWQQAFLLFTTRDSLNVMIQYLSINSC